MSVFKLAKQLGEKLLACEWKLVTAESCTGGGLSYWITSVEGSSQWFDRGFITYSNFSKSEMLGIDMNIIEKQGAVSETIAVAMAKGALARSGAQLSVAITGIAGPAGGSLEKPVGTVWICVAGLTFKSINKQYLFKGSRNEIREQAIHHALTQAIDAL
ncbi:MAG: CinA family protein [Proteobacteria bacterium]|nr:CinA family protein [Pseudomonadota bacterium]